MRRRDLLSQIPVFRGLDAEDRARLADRLTEKHFNPGQTIFSAGDPGSSMFIIASGAAEIFLPTPGGLAGERLVLKTVNAGEYFGELSLFDRKPRSASVVATMPTVALELTRNEVAEHVRGSSDVALAMLDGMADRLRETNAILTQRVTRNAVAEVEQNLSWDQRLADRVAELNGSWSFILFLVGLTGLWTLINLPALSTRLGFGGPNGGFDPYPYIFFNLILAILVALQGPLIVMSQNRQSFKDRRQAEIDFQVNLKNEVGIESLQRELAAFRAETGLRLGAIEQERDPTVKT